MRYTGIIFAFAVSIAAQAQTPALTQRDGTAVVLRDTSAPRLSAAPAQIVLDCHGDSITKTQGVVTEAYCGLIAGSIQSSGKTVSYLERGINGISYDYAWGGSGWLLTGIEDALQYIDLTFGTSSSTYEIIFMGSNGITIAGHTAAQEYSDFQTYIADRLAARPTLPPSHFMVVTMLPRDGVDEGTRSTFNASLVSGAATYHYSLCRLDLNNLIGQAGDQDNLTYYQGDGIHPNQTGQGVIQSVCYNSIAWN